MPSDCRALARAERRRGCSQGLGVGQGRSRIGAGWLSSGMSPCRQPVSATISEGLHVFTDRAIKVLIVNNIRRSDGSRLSFVPGNAGKFEKAFVAIGSEEAARCSRFR
jgi:hypothetical protein